MTDTDDRVMQRLLAGIKGFQKRYYEQSPEQMKELTEHGQKPKVLLIACSDSRVDPAILTGAAPGDLFVVRNVANLVPPYKLEGSHDGARTAIEYAVRDLGVNHIVVLGHAYCGGIKALLATLSGQPSMSLAGWGFAMLAGAILGMKLRYRGRPAGDAARG